ncbi:cofactor of BRCA1-domain-containing protein [Cokeromyces recurvatus]|uniref:cofactor of BRCA1-domain-containing protein n=1 Tax=Cokeromyces recurvatus TaxID=90255 RepID=UPI00221F8925|nr:cofactor of BRCA1-domain-containing protein [Cokeromyces recurvatus]KAI7900306.1 cofactor of BRCA1-domain-containing protein [Cokeromyces recurvatus]
MLNDKKQLIGPAEEEIRTLLSQSGDPLEAIKAIQKDYGLDLPDIENIYPLLELCGYSRLEIHKACLDALNKAVVEQIEKPTFQLENFYDLFKRTVPYIHAPLMQPIPMALLKKFERHIEDDVIEQLKNNMAVFENCPMNIKQRVWKQDESYFQQTMISLVNSYHHDEGLQSLALNIKPDNYQEIIEQRRQHPIIEKVMAIINQDPQIYEMFIKMIRIVFEATPHPSLCSLRVDILMNFHENNCHQITDLDPCHQLIFILDTCVRNQNMDETITERIKECFDDVENGSTLYADFAMILMEPMISNFLASMIVKLLKSTLLEKIPQSQSPTRKLVSYISKLLNLAQHAPVAIPNHTKIPKLEKELKENFWDTMCAMMLEKGPDTLYSNGEKIQNTMIYLLQKSDIARKVFTSYLIDCIREGNIYSLSRYLPFILETWPAPDFEEEGVIYRQTYLGFVKTMIDVLSKSHAVECITDERWKQGVIIHFLFKVVSWDWMIHEQMVRFLAEYYIDSKSLNRIGNQVTIITEWAEYMIINGFKDEKHLQKLKDVYGYLITRSNSILNGDYRINSPILIRFLSS